MAEHNTTRMRQLIETLNKASEAYYNGQGELMTDYEWDAAFDELKAQPGAFQQLIAYENPAAPSTPSARKEVH